MIFSRRFFRFYAVLIGLMVALLLCELGLRVFYRKIERITGVAEWELTNTSGYTNTRGYTYFWDQYHPRFGWTNLPGYISDKQVPFRVTINKQGLRAPSDYAPAPRAGKKRIAVFGDSTTFGEEVDDNQTVPFYLEQFSHDVEVLNFGVKGYGLGQMALRLEEEGFDFHPDEVLVVLLLPHDIPRDLVDKFDHNKPVFRIVDSQLTIGNIPVPVAYQQPWYYRHCFLAAWLFGRGPGILPPDESLGNIIAVMQAILHRIASQCAAHSLPCTLVLISDYRFLHAARSDQALGGAIDQLLGAAAQTEGLNVLDLTATLAEHAFEPDGGMLVAPRGHWSPQGNQLIARQIAEFLSGK
jgi:hypothetical protein